MTSTTEQIANLAAGESFAVSVRVPVGSPHADEQVRAVRDRMKNRLASYVARAKAARGGTFTTEVAVALSHDYTAILVSVVVTRLTNGRQPR